MSQFAYMNEINSVLNMDGDILRGPAPRWQKKLNASNAALNVSAANTSKISISYNSAMSTSMSMSMNKTPQKNTGVNFKGNRRTPGKSPGGGNSSNSREIVVLYFKIVGILI